LPVSATTVVCCLSWSSWFMAGLQPTPMFQCRPSMNAFALSPEMPVPTAPSPDTLTRCVVLALLLHAVALVWIGNVEGGSAAPGRGVWGRGDSIELRLGERGGEQTTTAAPAAPEASRGPVGPAASPRFGGAVREEEPPPPATPPAEPGAAQLGDWAPVKAPAAADRNLLPAATAPLAAPSPVGTPALPELARVAPAPPPERALAAEPLLRAPATAAPAPALERSTPLAAPAPLPELSTPSLARPLPVPEAAPVAPPPPMPAPTPTPTPAPVPTPTIAQPAPPQPSASPAPLPAAAATAEPAAAATPAPAGVPAPSSAATERAGPGRGAPDAGSRVGPDAATPPSAAASTPPLNLALPKNRGGPLSAGSTPGVLSLLPRPPEKNKLATEIDKSGKADCRTAYSGLGPLAVLPLAADALKKDGGCKW
jgi:hypothetical protein